MTHAQSLWRRLQGGMKIGTIQYSTYSTTGGKEKGGWEKMEDLPEVVVHKDLVKELTVIKNSEHFQMQRSKNFQFPSPIRNLGLEEIRKTIQFTPN